MKKGEKFTKPRICHGLTGTRIRAVWRHMMQRCYDSKRYGYQWYGARGIKVCERWHDLVNFAADMGHPPEGLTLDRINNDGDYEPSNCRWASPKEQARNTRRNRYLEFRGQRKIMTEWAQEMGIRDGTLFQRLARGLSVEDALTLPIGRWASARR
jgi:hypothetical protein